VKRSEYDTGSEVFKMAYDAVQSSSLSFSPPLCPLSLLISVPLLSMLGLAIKMQNILVDFFETLVNICQTIHHTPEHRNLVNVIVSKNEVGFNTTRFYIYPLH
jgi:hypothetical protein